MAVKRYDELMAWQLAEQFSQETQRLVRASARASQDFRYRNQLLDASSATPKDIAEGFLRFSAATFIQFIDYGLGSLVEAELRLKDGITRGYYSSEDCERALQLARRCLTAMVRLKQSQQRYLHQRRHRPDDTVPGSKRS